LILHSLLLIIILFFFSFMHQLKVNVVIKIEDSLGLISHKKHYWLTQSSEYAIDMSQFYLLKFNLFLKYFSLVIYYCGNVDSTGAQSELQIGISIRYKNKKNILSREKFCIYIASSSATCLCEVSSWSDINSGGFYKPR
jgi:hypothetical protein